MNGCATAKFASGQYYFDFRDEERGTGQNVLNIATTVIGGEYVGTAIPGACKSPILNDPIPGVQFVFGGTSRITVSDTARVELCGPSNGGEPPIDALPGADRQHRAQRCPSRHSRRQTVTQVTGPKVDPFTIDGGGTGQAALAAARRQQPQVGRGQQQQRGGGRPEQLLGPGHDPGRVRHHVGAGPGQVREVEPQRPASPSASPAPRLR